MNIDSIKVNLQYFLPKHLLTKAVGILAAAKLGKITTAAVRGFIRVYDINTAEIKENLEDFATFNDFFARALKPEARPIDESADSLVFPVDGRISQFGNLCGNFQLQAKDHYFTIEALLGNKSDAAYFTDGKFITVYLSPQDYHRVHIPTGGRLLKMTYIPGELFSVNPLYTSNIPELFSRNERVVCLFDTDIGKMAVILVGATTVRSIATQWAGTVAPSRSDEIYVETYENKNISFAKGDEIGKFMMGSTVICLFEKKQVDFMAGLQEKQKTRFGQKMAVMTASTSVIKSPNKVKKKSPIRATRNK